MTLSYQGARFRLTWKALHGDAGWCALLLELERQEKLSPSRSGVIQPHPHHIVDTRSNTFYTGSSFSIDSVPVTEFVQVTSASMFAFSCC